MAPGNIEFHRVGNIRIDFYVNIVFGFGRKSDNTENLLFPEIIVFLQMDIIVNRTFIGVYYDNSFIPVYNYLVVFFDVIEQVFEAEYGRDFQ